MNMNTANLSIQRALTPPTPAASWDTPDSNYTLNTTFDRFTQSAAKDLNAGHLSPEVNKMVDAVRWPGKTNAPQVQVKTFAVDGIQAKDIIFIKREPAVLDGPNIVLFIPEKETRSFQSFKNLGEMNAWLKEVANDPTQLATFSQHFAEGGSEARTQRVNDTMIRFKDNDINAVVGPYADEGSDIFTRLDNGPFTSPTAVNGLTKIMAERISSEGRVLYSGQRTDGTTVLFQYDAYCNLLGEDKNKNFYFVKNGLNNHKPLVPMTIKEFTSNVQNEAAIHVGANDIRGFYEELLTHLEHPFSGLGDALHVFGVNKNTADTVERYFDNPFSALLLDLNKDNQIGKVLGLEKSAMDSELKSAGGFAQGFVPYYGQARALSALLAKAIRNEPMSDQEKRDLADGLALKPDSPTVKTLPKSNASGKPHSYEPEAPAIKPTAPIEAHIEEHAPHTEPAEPAINRLRPSQWSDISSYAIAEGEQLISGAHANAKGMYQVKGPEGTDRWFVRLTDDTGASRVYEIDGKFKLSDGYANIIDPATKKPLMTVHAIGDGAWEPINGPGGIWPWESGSSKTKAFDPGAYDYPAGGEASSSKTTDKIDKRLKQDADTYHKNVKAKTRPVLAQMPQNTSPQEALNIAYQKSSGIIIGEDHSQSAGLKVLIDNAAVFKSNQVTTLYSEGFEHAVQPDLDKFFETGEFTKALRENLKLIDRAHRGHGPYTNRALLETMREHGIRVKAIDVPSVEPKATRLKNMNYYASQLIEQDQALNPQSK